MGSRVTLGDPPACLGVCSVTVSGPLRPGLGEPLHLMGGKRDRSIFLSLEVFFFLWRFSFVMQNPCHAFSVRYCITYL